MEKKFFKKGCRKERVREICLVSHPRLALPS